MSQNNKYMYQVLKEFEETLKGKASKTLIIALKRGENEIKVKELKVLAENQEKNLGFVERVIKSMLWIYGGYKFYIFGDKQLTDSLRTIYSKDGERAFDYEFMSNVYGSPLCFESVSDISDMPKECEKPIKVNAVKTGRRVGFDAGGSDRKVTASIDGKVVYEKEIVWHPKLHSDIEYHIDGIKDSIDAAKKKLGGTIDSIGVSTAGIVVDNEVRVASLFRSVPKCDYDKVKNIYKNLEKDYNCKVKVANDGDVAALTGAFNLNSGKILGIAMGTSLAGGYIDSNINIKGYLNELAFVPIYSQETGATDEWSKDKGVGAPYLSQDGAIRLAEEYGLEINKILTPGDKLKDIQKYVEKNNPVAMRIFTTIGEYFAHSLLWYSYFYDIDKVILMGRVVSGKGGKLILQRCEEVLKSEGSNIEIKLPDESARRLGQSYTASLL